MRILLKEFLNYEFKNKPHKLSKDAQDLKLSRLISD